MNATQSASQITVPFHGSNLFVLSHNDQPYTPMKSIVEGMGMDWKSQHSKLSSNDKRFCMVEITTQLSGDDQQRAVSCLPLRKLPGWLMSIHPNKVRAEIREKVITYQNECDDALWDYWTKGQANRTIPQDHTAYLGNAALAVRNAVKRKARGNRAAYSAIYNMIYDMLQVTSYKEIPAEKVGAAIALIESYPVLEGEVLPPEEKSKPALDSLMLSAAAQLTALRSHGYSFTRYMVSFDADKANVQEVEMNAFVMSLKRLAVAINEPNGFHPSNAELANLGKACMDRLALRMEYAEKQKLAA